MKYKLRYLKVVIRQNDSKRFNSFMTVAVIIETPVHSNERVKVRLTISVGR